VTEFRREAQDDTDPDVKAWAGQMVTVLEKHLQMARALPTR
jgi:hypothetical protein